MAHGVCLAQARVIAWVNDGVSPTELELVAPVVLADTTVGGPFALYNVLPGNDPDLAEESMRQSGLVQFAEDDLDVSAPENQSGGKGGTIGAVFDPTNFSSENRAWLAQIGWRKLPVTFGARSIRVGILDTGVSQQNRYLRDRVVAAQNFCSDRSDWFDAPSGVDTNLNGVPDDAAGHGSMVAGILNRLSWRSDFVVARVADSDGVSTAWRLIEGLVFSVTNGAEVVNVSLGSITGIVAVQDVVEHWVEPRGALVVAAAGNDQTSHADEPARYSEVVCVAGVDEADKKAVFSNWDSKTRACAPCTGIKSAWWDGNMAVWSGTSFAAPMVTAAVAEGLCRRPAPIGFAKLSDLRTWIRTSGDNVDPLNLPYQGALGRRLNFARLVFGVPGL